MSALSLLSWACRPSLVAVMGAAALVVSACGNEGPSATTSTPTQGAPADDVSPPDDSDADGIRLNELLVRPTARPAGLSKQFRYATGAGPGPCTLEPDEPPITEPRIAFQPNPFQRTPFEPPQVGQPDAGEATYGQLVDICLYGFGPGPVDVVVTDPDGRKERGQFNGLPAVAADFRGYHWMPVIHPSWPLGRYTIAARSDDGRATLSFDLVAPEHPGITAVGASSADAADPDTTARVFLTGFPGGERIRLDVYREQHTPNGSAPYFSSATIDVPTSGNAVVSMLTSRPRRSTTYVITSRARGVTVSDQLSVNGEEVAGPAEDDPTSVFGSLPQP